MKTRTIQHIFQRHLLTPSLFMLRTVAKLQVQQHSHVSGLNYPPVL